MRYYGIKTPPNPVSYIHWIARDRFDSWRQFFREDRPHRLPMEEAIRAYESVGYTCVALDVTEVDVECGEQQGAAID